MVLTVPALMTSSALRAIIGMFKWRARPFPEPQGMIPMAVRVWMSANNVDSIPGSFGSYLGGMSGILGALDGIVIFRMVNLFLDQLWNCFFAVSSGNGIDDENNSFFQAHVSSLAWFRSTKIILFAWKILFWTDNWHGNLFFWVFCVWSGSGEIIIFARHFKQAWIIKI